jgi:hypothetical protein
MPENHPTQASDKHANGLERLMIAATRSLPTPTQGICLDFLDF